MLCDRGVLVFESSVWLKGEGTTAQYLGSSQVGWNHWAPRPETYLAMLRDCGFDAEHQVDQVGGKAWFMATRTPTIPLIQTGLAGFSRPDLLDLIGF